MRAFRPFLPFLTFLPLVTGILLLFIPASGNVGSNFDLEFVPPQQDLDTIEPEKLIFLLQYIGTDYAAAVRSGEIISEFEYREMVDFSQVLLQQYERLSSSQEALSELQELKILVQQKRDPSEVRDSTLRLIPLLSQELSVISYPTIAPDLSRGQELFVRDCSECHGQQGKGDGPSAKESDPAPRSFFDPRMNRLAPHQIFNAVSFGVEGTDMPSHLESLSDQERWDVAFFVMTFREGFKPVPPQTPLPLSLRDLAIYSNDQLQVQLRRSGSESELGHIDYYRNEPPGASLNDLLILSGQKLDQSMEAYRAKDVGLALKLVLDAYLEGIEPVEPTLKQQDYNLSIQLEGEFLAYRTALSSGMPLSEVSARYEDLRGLVDSAQQTVRNSDAGRGFTFVQSFTIILREGIEAALLLGVMFTYLSAAGYHQLQKYVGAGAGAGVLVGVATWWVAQVVLGISSFQQEALEGLTSLLAAAVLFSVSFWVIHQIDIRHWKEYIQTKAERALGTGSGVALATAAFLAVYREAAETVLFYQALWVRSTSERESIVAGFLVGAVVLGLLVVLMFRYGVRIPLKPFFTITGVLLGLLAFVFAGYGVRELQTIGWIKETHLGWIGHFPVLEIRPTLESSALQLGILLSFLISWFGLNRPTLTNGKIVQ